MGQVLSYLSGIIENVWDTAERLLRLLALLQGRGDCNAEQIAGELEVTTRTVRRDIARLRDLGYPVDAARGSGGGYQLQPGTALPPLMFDSDEAVAALLALRDWAVTGDPNTSASALSALDKLSRVMPNRLRPTVRALTAHSSSLDLGMLISGSTAPVALSTLVLLARACREERRVTFTYRRHDGAISARRVEPLHLVRTLGRWYLVAYCLDAGAWRTFRLDHLSDPTITRHPSHRREPPAADPNDYVATQVAASIQRVTATVRVHAPRDAVAPWILPAWGTVTKETPETCIVKAGAETHTVIARWLLLLDAPLTVIDPPELGTAFAELATTSARIADAATVRGGLVGKP